MRTTITLQDSLLDAAKKRAMERHSSLSAVVEDALRASLYQQEIAPSVSAREPWPVYGTGGLHPGVDLRDNSGVLDRMESE